MNVELEAKIHKIVNQVAIFNKTTLPELHSEKQSRDIVTARYMTWQILYECFGTRINLTTLGDIFGKKHCTVIYARKTFPMLVESEKDLKKCYEKCLSVCRKIADADPKNDKINDLKSVLNAASNARSLNGCKKNVLSAIKLVNSL